MLADMDTVGSPTRGILQKLAFLVTLNTVYCLQSNVNKIDDVLTNTFLNKTIADNNRQEDLRRDMENKLLTIMGLHQRPNPTKINALENSAVQYMLELYKMINDDDGLGVEPNRVNTAFVNTHVPDRHEINRASLIMSFSNHAHKHPNLPLERKLMLYFNFTDVLPGLISTHAEVNLYKERTTMEDRSQLLIEIFMIRRGTNKGDTNLQPVTNLSVSKSYEGWISTKVTDAAKYWTVNREENLGLYLRATDVEMGQYIDPDKSGIVVKEGPESKRSFLVSYFKKPNEDHVPYTRSKRQLKDISATNDSSEGDFKEDFLDDYIARKKTQAVYNRLEICRRQEMYVNITDLGWNSWIISPSGYQAYYCTGDCRFPMADHLKPTVHAMLQTIVRDTGLANVPRVCCVPTKLAPLDILYHSDGSVVYKPYQNMIVKECGFR
ncbi:hypothetical protein CHS0354_034241 [Potamilus streckersoni]|uniref:TGF-beta family profile domain-containing protein n=1 Tax=Potamilus streckersoni TaxID=2493646 RepID=A0AAE0W2U7_9BIVA|nr:hypothetical protein CHS0354_034241 [Potamilus streckersoni]